MKRQDVLVLINALAPIKISKVEKDTRVKVLKFNYELQKVGKGIEDFVEQSRKALFVDLQDQVKEVSKMRDNAKGDKVELALVESKVKKQYPEFADQEKALNQAYYEHLQEEIKLECEMLTDEEIISIYDASDIALSLADLTILNNIINQ